jgi:hypothetical protein
VRQLALMPLVALSVAMACNGTSRSAIGGRLEASWIGADTGRMAASSSAEWCADPRVLEIRAVQGDTGLAVALYPLDTIEADTYRVVHPEAADTGAPSAGVALRLFVSNAVEGYQGDSGNVVLQQSKSGALFGTLEARARSVVNGQQVRVSGKFQDVVIAPQSRGCGPASADSIDTNAGPPGTE